MRNGIIEPHRIIKTEPQIERMRAAARAAEAGLNAAIEAIAPGKTENDLAAAMFQANIAAGSEYLGHPPLVVAGQRTALCFAMWRRNVIKKGDVILLEAAGCVDRYHARHGGTVPQRSAAELRESHVHLFNRHGPIQ